jgi:hypothetical protein
MALGYSVSNGTNVFSGIRYTGRLRNDVANQMPQGEGVIVNGGGSQTDPFARWGDYTSMNIDPVDNCRFWYANEYYQTTSRRPRPAAGKLGSPRSGCPAAPNQHDTREGRPGLGRPSPDSDGTRAASVPSFVGPGSCSIRWC